MLIEAFKRKLTFSIGQSLTTSENDVIIWAGIHHKTNLKGGEHGFPDPKYFDNLWGELKERGIEPFDVNPTPPDSGEIKSPGDQAQASQQKSSWFGF